MTETMRFRGKWTALAAGLALLAGCRKAKPTEWIIYMEGNTSDGKPLPDVNVRRGQTILLKMPHSASKEGR